MSSANSTRFLNFAIVLFLILWGVNLWLTWEWTSPGAQVDLRNRIVGARLLWEKPGDIYHYKWHEGEPLRYYDGYVDYSPTFPYNNVTVSPSALALFSVFNHVPYSITKNIWFAAQWLFLLGIFLLILPHVKRSPNLPYLIIFMGLVPWVYLWFFHLERGQYYVLFAFLLAIMANIFGRNTKHWPLLAAFVLGYLITMRPTVALFAIPLLFRKSLHFVAGGIMAGLILGAFPQITSDSNMSDPWNSFMECVRGYGGVRTTAVYPPSVGSVEGVPDLKAVMQGIPGIGLSLKCLYSAVTQGAVIPKRVLEILFIGAGILALSMIFRSCSKNSSYSTLFCHCTGWFTFVEFFSPSLRCTYNDVMLVPAFALIVAKVEFRRENLPLLSTPWLFILLNSAGFSVLYGLSFYLAFALAIYALITVSDRAFEEKNQIA